MMRAILYTSWWTPYVDDITELEIDIYPFYAFFDI